MILPLMCLVEKGKLMSRRNAMDLKDFDVYQRAMNVGEQIWGIVEGWTFFQKDTVGKQLVRAADSIAANISEGHGRYHYGEKRQFCYYSRGSLQETITWLTKAYSRGLIHEDQFVSITASLTQIRRMLNGYIRSIS